MVAWLGASGALAAVMPYCDHALRSVGGDPAPTAAAHHDPHQAHQAHEGHHAQDGGQEAGAQVPEAHAGLACDDCGSCHLLGSGFPAALMPDSAIAPATAPLASMSAAFRGHIPEQPYHPPKTSPAA
jgi:hypothetical protein